MADELRLTVCQHFQPEMVALAGEPEFAGVRSSTFPSLCEHPQEDRSKWQQKVTAPTGEDDQVIFVCGCFHGTAKGLPATEHLRIASLDQCLHLIASRNLVDHYLQKGAYLLSPGWLEDWPLRIARWGFDQTTARQFFGECATKLVLLDTGVCTNTAQRLQAFATYLNLPTETVPVGLDHFRLFMRQFILEWRQDQSTREIKAAFARANQRVADYAMAVDLMANLTGMRTEAEVVAGILELFTMLFAPDSLVYFPVSGDQLGTPQAGQVSAEGIAAVQTWLVNDSEEYAWLPERNGFRLRLLYQAATIGLLEVAEVAFPNHRREYLNLAMAMARVCGMAVANARLFQQVQLSANTDSLTGLFNRRFFFQLSGTEWERAQRYGKLLSAIIFDIDHFKRVNDVYGHVAGDHVLTSIAGRCRGTLRTSDILGRYGGEEFIVLLPETNLSEAYELAERLRRTVAAVPFEPDGRALTLTISLGVATLDTSCASFDDLVCRCDEALYRAKAYGRNQTQTWEV